MLGFRVYCLVVMLAIGCKTTKDSPLSEEQEQEQTSQSEAVRMKFIDLSKAAELLNFDLQDFALKTFTPQLKAALKLQFKPFEKTRKKLKDSPSYERLAKYYPKKLLDKVEYVTVDKFPSMGEIFTTAKVDRKKLASFGIQIDKKVWDFAAAAITLGNTVYIAKSEVDSASTFFHECVHVVQYDQLGVDAFLEEYGRAVLAGVVYERIPFEMVAYHLESVFSKGEFTFNADAYVRKRLKATTTS